MSALATALAAARRLGPADELVAGVLDLAGARSLALDSLLTVSAVEWSVEIGSACVECADRPRMLLNPSFVEQKCTTRERLAMLILHELSHISLGHTRLYPRPTVLHNIAFDAVINASLLNALCRGADPGDYAALMEDCYAADENPLFILRPPPGWPERPDWDASGGCDPTLREIHRRLYARSATGADGLASLTYTEIITALVRSISEDGGADEEGLAGLLARLLGAHGATETERRAATSGRDALAAELMGDTIQALDLNRGIGGAGGAAYLRKIERRRAERALEVALRDLLRRAFVESSDGTPRRVASTSTIISPDPTRDRRAATRRATARLLGAPAPLLFHSEVERRRPDRRAAIVYLDVSGSMDGLLERLYAALLPLRRLLAAELFVFSTEVVPVSREALLRGELPSTGGTSVQPVLDHLCRLRTGSRPGPLRALVLTDGYFNDPSATAVQALRAAGHQIHLGVLGPGPMHGHSSWIASSTRLPDPLTANVR
jgi:hypothetical protein